MDPKTSEKNILAHEQCSYIIYCKYTVYIDKLIFSPFSIIGEKKSRYKQMQSKENIKNHVLTQLCYIANNK